MLILEIAAGIVLAVVFLRYWEVLLSVAVLVVALAALGAGGIWLYTAFSTSSLEQMGRNLASMAIVCGIFALPFGLLVWRDRRRAKREAAARGELSPPLVE